MIQNQKRRMSRKAVSFLLLLSLVLLVGKGWHWLKDGYRVDRALFPLESSTKWRFAPLSEHEKARILSILKQPFFYLGRGHQCYAFESKDGRYVLKLPRHDRYRVSFFRRASSWPSSDDLRGRKDFLLKSFEIAYEDLKKETALVCVHLTDQEEIEATLRVVDRLGRLSLLDANRVGFILQEKKELMMPALQRAVVLGERANAEAILDALLNVIVIRAKKGISNKDPSFLTNFAYENGVGIQIDTGSFYRKEEISFSHSIHQTVGPVREWLAKIDPELLLYFNRRVGEIEAKEVSP